MRKRKKLTLLQSNNIGRIWGTYRQPICSPYVTTHGQFQKQPNHTWPIMLSNVWENLRAELQQWGTCGQMWSFCIQNELFWTYGQHMGKRMGIICGAYLKLPINTQSNTQQNLSLPLLMQHPQVQSSFHQICFESPFIINKDGRMNSEADEILTWQQASAFVFTIHLML